MELEQMSSAELISLVRRQEQELAAVRAALELSHARQLELESPVAQQGGGELPQDDLLNKIVSALEGYADSYDLMSRIGRRGDVQSTSVAFDIRRNMVDAVRNAFAQRAASVPAQPTTFDAWYHRKTHMSREHAQIAFDAGVASVRGQAGQQPSAWRVGFDLFNSHKEALANVRNPSVEVEPLYTAPAASVQPELTVWYGPMPESNGKSNFTATLMRKGASLFDTNQFTFSRSEYPERVRYDADSMRYLIGEIDTEPCVMDYDGDKHSGYVDPHHKQPDIGRDAALEDDADAYTISVMGKLLADIALTLKGQEKALHRHSYHDLPDLVAELKLAADLATQAAPEVASVPDAGDEPVAWLYETPMPDGGFMRGSSVERLEIGVGVTTDTKERPLYTRPQPAPAVLTDAQIEVLAAKYLTTRHEQFGPVVDGHRPFARAVLAAAAK